MTSSVTREIVDTITVITLQRPQVRNAVNRDAALALFEAFTAFDQDDASPVAVFHGAYGHFCAGWDLQAGAKLAHVPQSDEAMAYMQWPADQQQPVGPMGPSRMLLSKPVIAAIAGAAVAGGMELALWCDMRVVEEDAYFGVYCRRFGVPLIDGGTVRLPRLIGMGHAMDLILTGRKVEAAEALSMGLANRVVPMGQAREHALALAKTLAGFPQATLRTDRASAYAQWDLPLHDALRQEWEGGSARIGDALKGAQAFSRGAGRHGAFEEH